MTDAIRAEKNGRLGALLGLMLLLAGGFVGAAHVFGTIFDENIQAASRAVVQINTTPEQQFITLNGTYSFNIPPGNYRLTAVGQNASAEKNVTILTDGDFRIDLILLPGVPAEDGVLTDLLSAAEVEPPASATGESFNPFWLLVPAALMALLAGIYAYRHKLAPNAPDRPDASTPPAHRAPHVPTPIAGVPGRVLSADQQKVMQTLASFNNRASQKDLRRALDHWSEAKVSMELTELDEMGAIQKIKKGRGNIIRRA